MTITVTTVGKVDLLAVSDLKMAPFREAIALLKDRLEDWIEADASLQRLVFVIKVAELAAQCRGIQVAVRCAPQRDPLDAGMSGSISLCMGSSGEHLTREVFGLLLRLKQQRGLVLVLQSAISQWPEELWGGKDSWKIELLCSRISLQVRAVNWETEEHSVLHEWWLSASLGCWVYGRVSSRAPVLCEPQLSFVEPAASLAQYLADYLGQRLLECYQC